MAQPQQSGKYYADPAYKPGGRYGPRGDIYLDPGMDTSKMTPPDPLAGLRAAAAERAMKPGDPVGPFDVRVPDTVKFGPLKGSDPIPPMPFPPAPASAFAPSDLPIPGLPDPNDPGLIEGEGLPGEYKGMGDGAGGDGLAGGSQVPGLSWRWGSKGAPSASQLADQRASFLATGASPEIGLMADAARGRELVDENLRNRPDLLEARSNLAGLKAKEANTPEGKAAERARILKEQDADLAMNGLWRAKAKAKAGIEEPKAKAEAFLDPTVSRARWTADMDPINIALSPGAQQLTESERQHQLSLAGIRAASQAMMYGGDPGIWPGMGGENQVGAGAGYAAAKGQAPADAAGGQKIATRELINQVVAKTPGMTYLQAVELAKQSGWVVPADAQTPIR